MIKRIAKLIIPKKIIFLTKSSLAYWYDIKRYTNNSNTYYSFDNPNKIKGRLTTLYHIIEKGLTMPETRLGFGEKAILDLVELCYQYRLKRYNVKDQVFVHSVEVLNEYLRFHDLNNFTIDSNTINRINKLASDLNIYSCSTQFEFSNYAFFKEHKSSFDKFCKSRHTVRNFTQEKIPLDTIYQCIELANESPSACNRQPTRVYIIKDRQKIIEILELQNGNRGFGHLTNTLLLISSDISVFYTINERNESLLNAGLFSMTLIYALHFYKIGACLLNWSSSNENDRKLRTIIKIPDNEQVAVIIACGYLPDKFKIACSPRLKVTDITHEII